MVATTSLLGPKNNRQQSDKAFWPSIMDTARDVRHSNTYSNYQSLFNAITLSMTLSVWRKIKWQRSLNELRPSILDIVRAVQLHCSILELFAAIVGKNAEDKIVSMSNT